MDSRRAYGLGDDRLFTCLRDVADLGSGSLSTCRLRIDSVRV